MSATIPPKRVLPQKEAALFRTILQMYETKLYKKGIKTADTILKKFPEHGETLCMKGLILHSMDRREEGLELIRKGVRLDLTSHIVWHVYGIAHKSEKNYEETLKCYLQALKFDKENINILREVAQLQLQLRHFEAHVETRNILLRLRPQLRQNWFALAVAYYLNGDDGRALTVLRQLGGSLKNLGDGDTELSDILLFHARVLEATGDYAAALAFLEEKKAEHRILDRVAIRLSRARLLSKLDRSEDARQSWKRLLERNPDCYEYYRAYLACEGLSLDHSSPDVQPRLYEMLKKLSSSFKGSTTPLRLALDVADDATFRNDIHPYLLSGLRRGSPSLFSDVKSLYKDDAKRLILEDVVLRIREELAASNTVTDTVRKAEGEAPSTYLWILYFLSQHYSYLRQHERALSLINEALEHTPALPEILMVKARILKRAGDPYGAAQWMERARLLDGQDRFLNGKCAKYLLRSGHVDAANRRLGLFTKKDAPSPGADLEEMQSLAYLQQEGDAWLAQGKFGRALKRYCAIVKIFGDYEDDQFDFYAYSLRKFTFNAYLELLAFEDRLHSHAAYLRAAIAAAKIYIKLHDDPELLNQGEQDRHNRKKKREAAAVNGAVINGKAHDVAGATKDDDAEGHSLLAIKDPLAKAHTLLARADGLVLDHVEYWLTTFDVAFRRQRYLQALRALLTAKSYHPEHPGVHIRIVLLASEDWPAKSSLVARIVEHAVKDITSERPLDLYNADYLQRNPNHPAAILAAAQALHGLDGGNRSDEVHSLLRQLVHPQCESDVRTCLDALQFVGEAFGSEAREVFRKSCAQRYPLATVFLPPEEQEAHRRALKLLTEASD